MTDAQGTMNELLAPIGEFARRRPLAVHEPLAGEERPHPDRAPHMDLVRARGNVSAQAKAGALGHLGAGVPEHTGTVHFPQELVANLEFRIYNRLFQIVLLMIYKNCTIHS